MKIKDDNQIQINKHNLFIAKTYAFINKISHKLFGVPTLSEQNLHIALKHALKELYITILTKQDIDDIQQDITNLKSRENFGSHLITGKEITKNLYQIENILFVLSCEIELQSTVTPERRKEINTYTKCIFGTLTGRYYSLAQQVINNTKNVI